MKTRTLGLAFVLALLVASTGCYSAYVYSSPGPSVSMNAAVPGIKGEPFVISQYFVFASELDVHTLLVQHHGPDAVFQNVIVSVYYDIASLAVNWLFGPITFGLLDLRLIEVSGDVIRPASK